MYEYSHEYSGQNTRLETASEIGRRRGQFRSAKYSTTTVLVQAQQTKYSRFYGSRTRARARTGQDRTGQGSTVL